MTQQVRDWVAFVGLARLIVTALSVLAVGAGGYWLLRPPPTPVESNLPRATAGGSPVAGATASTSVAVAGAPPATAAATTTTSTGVARILVHVAGAVRWPGVYRVSGAARVIDAVTAAGGPTNDAVLDAVNLAAALHDGDRVTIPTTGDAAPVPAGVTPSASAVAAGGTGQSALVPSAEQPIDINTAGVDELEALPGVGPATAAAIVAHREANGPFASVDALGDVRGIGPAKLEAMRALVTV